MVGGVFKMYDFKAKIICNINIRFVRLGETGKMKFERFWSAKATPRSTSTRCGKGASMSCQARSLEDLFGKIESRTMAVYRRYLDELGGADVTSGRRPSTAGLAGWTICAKSLAVAINTLQEISFLAFFRKASIVLSERGLNSIEIDSI